MTHRVITLAALTALALAAGSKLALKDLPPAVQKTVEAEAQGATIKNIVKEKEKGKTVYEVETTRQGKTRDFVVDSSGTLEVVEEETELAALPPGVQAAVLKKVADGKVTTVEVLKKGTQVTYEAVYKTKAGKTKEVIVTAEGHEVK